jgi:hypothetical protein
MRWTSEELCGAPGGMQVEEEVVPDSSDAGDSTPFNVKLRSLEQRVAAMGGRLLA